MDEQAGPGVFFNNNNNSGLPGAGNIKPPQAADVGGGETARAQYSIPGILHFLQHEWARFEVERAQWEVERTELQICRRCHGSQQSHHILTELLTGQFSLFTFTYRHSSSKIVHLSNKDFQRYNISRFLLDIDDLQSRILGVITPNKITKA